MGPLIILDKSSLQALSKDEIYFLFKHYYVVVTPVLIAEILGDLKKQNITAALSQEQVVQLSNKLLSFDSIINADYRKLLIGDLLGHKVKMTGQAIVDGGIEVVDDKGEKGFFLDEQPLRKQLNEWQRGNFSAEDAVVAQNWREMIGKIDLSTMASNTRKISGSNKINSLRAVDILLNIFLNNSNYALQSDLLLYIFEQFHIGQKAQDAILDKWHYSSKATIKTFAPYAFYCLKLHMFFVIGLVHNLIGTRSTNIIDLRYLYYLPFCMVFSSGDKFHVDLSPFFLGTDQDFVLSKDLKQDLSLLKYEWEHLSPEQKKDRAVNYGSYPPQDNKYITQKLWVKHMRPWQPGSGNRAESLTEEQHKKIIDRINSIMAAVDKKKDEES